MTDTIDDAMTVPLTDRGLAYGDGLFETVLVRDGVPALWHEHCERFTLGAQRLGIEAPSRDWLDALIEKAPAGLQVLKIMLTRGSGGRGYRPPVPATPRFYWQFIPFTPMSARWESGIRVRLCRLKLGRQPALAGIKHLNRLENVLARQEWQDDAIAEGILLNDCDQLVEATAMNLAWHDHGQWWTPALTESGVEGTLRRALVENGQLAVVSAAPLSRLLQADGACLLNSVQGLWPITQCCDPDHQHVLARWQIDEPVRHLQREAHRLLGHAPTFSTS